MTEHIRVIEQFLSAQPHYKVVFLGMGKKFKLPPENSFTGWWYTEFEIRNKLAKLPGGQLGIYEDRYYFAAEDSDVARLNRHFPTTTEIKKRIKL